MTNDTSWSGRVLPYANFRLDLLWSCKLQKFAYTGTVVPYANFSLDLLWSCKLRMYLACLSWYCGPLHKF